MDPPTTPITRARKRKTPSDKPSDTRADRKRVQNRISQQCLREKQLAHTRQLESFLEIIKSSNDESKNNEDRYSTLLDAHLKLIEEKRQLEDALFRLRKRLLSLSNIASTAADDEIFAQLLDKDGRRRRNDNSEAPHEALIHSNKSNLQRQAHTPQEDVAGASQHLGHVNARPSTDEHSLRMTPPAIPAPAMQQQQQHHRPHENALTPGGHYNGQLQHNLIPNDAVMTQSMDGVDHELMSAPNMHFDPALETSPPPYMIYDHLTAPIHAMSFGAVKTIAVTSAAIFSDKLANACQKYLNQVLGPRPTMDMESDDEESCALSPESMNVRVVRQLSATAIYLFGAFSGMEAYIYGVDAAPYMDRVMRWRLSNTVNNRMAVPEPFRPTPLQYSSPDHPLYIDFINWPSIRDQLIIHGHTIDHDEVIRDIVLNTVVEIEHRKIAINIYDIFHNRILSTGSRTSGSRSKSAIVTADWKFVEVPAADNSFETTTDPVEDALVQELSWRMQFGLNGSSNNLDGVDKFAGPSDPDGPFEVFPWSNPTFRKNEIASYFGIDRLSQWKLSPAFARKYPLFDCTAVVSQFEMITCAAATVF